MCYVLFIHSSMNGYLGGFHFLATVKNAAMKFMYRFWCECFLFFVFSFLGRYLGVGWLGHVVPPGVRSCQIAFKEAAQLYVPSSNVWGFHVGSAFHVVTYLYYCCFTES